MNNSWAKVICDSIGPNNKRLISVEARYWRAIHAEIMTHRDRARNAASSRAIPFIRYGTCKTCKDWQSQQICTDCNGSGKVIVPNCTYSYIMNDPFTPEFIGLEQRGMQSGGELSGLDRDSVERSIDRMRQFCLEECKLMYERGCHKSIINRYLEPWSYITIIMTATEWKNFFRLRVHPKAEKHFNKVAGQIRDAIVGSVPRQLAAGEWHLPYIGPEDQELPLETLKRVSAARCARLSYLTHDGLRDVNADLRIFDTLIHPKIEQERDDDVIHSSPLEHVAEASSDSAFRSGPFIGWKQFRKEFPNENVEG